MSWSITGSGTSGEIGSQLQKQIDEIPDEKTRNLLASLPQLAEDLAAIYSEEDEEKGIKPRYVGVSSSGHIDSNGGSGYISLNVGSEVEDLEAEPDAINAVAGENPVESREAKKEEELSEDQLEELRAYNARRAAGGAEATMNVEEYLRKPEKDATATNEPFQFKHRPDSSEEEREEVESTSEVEGEDAPDNPPSDGEGRED